MRERQRRARSCFIAKNTTEIANELTIATTSHHALMRHQNQRSRYSSPVPAPIEISTSNASCADSAAQAQQRGDDVQHDRAQPRPTIT